MATNESNHQVTKADCTIKVWATLENTGWQWGNNAIDDVPGMSGNLPLYLALHHCVESSAGVDGFPSHSQDTDEQRY
jgi:hypothetical protein